MGHKSKQTRQLEAERRRLMRDVPELKESLDEYSRGHRSPNEAVWNDSERWLHYRNQQNTLDYSKGLQRLEELNRILSSQ